MEWKGISKANMDAVEAGKLSMAFGENAQDKLPIN